MLEWLESIAGPAYATAMLWTLGALLLLVVLLLLIKVVRSLSFGTFVSGGRNRKTRLAVMDATAVDSQRRLVLVRRDDVEHLILIGGPTDVVVEQNIRLIAHQRRPADDQAAPREVRLPPDSQVMAPTPTPPMEAANPIGLPPAPAETPVRTAPEVAPRPAEVRPLARPQPTPPPPVPPRPVQPVAPASVQPRPTPAPQHTQPSAPAIARPVAPVQPQPRPATPPRAVNDPGPSLDDALMEELEVTLDRNAQSAQQKTGAQNALPSSVEDEMSRLLGDLARPRR